MPKPSPKTTILAALRGEAVPGLLPTSLIGGGTWTLAQSQIGFEEALRAPRATARLMADMARRLGDGIVFGGHGFNNALPAALVGTPLVYRDNHVPFLGGQLAPEQSASMHPGQGAQDETLGLIQEMIGYLQVELGGTFPLTLVSWGPFTLAGQIFGVEAWLRLCLQDPVWTAKILAATSEAIYQFYQPVLDKVDLIYLAEPLASGDLISPTLFRSLLLKPLDELLGLLAGGRPTLLHICGDTRIHLAAIAELKNLAAYSFDHKVSLTQARADLPNMAIGGNLDPLLLLDGPPAEIASLVQKLLPPSLDHRGLILMPGCDLPPATPLANVAAFFQAARELGSALELNGTAFGDHPRAISTG